jgi:putative Mn2+ efflux pump MntP
LGGRPRRKRLYHRNRSLDRLRSTRCYRRQNDLGERQPFRRAAKPNRHSLNVLIVTAIGTSIDAMAVGVTLAFIDANIVVTVLAIGCATFLMATVGILIGRLIGEKLGRIAEAIGGIGLIVIGAKILIEHTLIG